MLIQGVETPQIRNLVSIFCSSYCEQILYKNISTTMKVMNHFFSSSLHLSSYIVLTYYFTKTILNWERNIPTYTEYMSLQQRFNQDFFFNAVFWVGCNNWYFKLFNTILTYALDIWQKILKLVKCETLLKSISV